MRGGYFIPAGRPKSADGHRDDAIMAGVAIVEMLRTQRRKRQEQYREICSVVLRHYREERDLLEDMEAETTAIIASLRLGEIVGVEALIASLAEREAVAA